MMESVTATWLSPSSTTRAMDMVFAFACGLVLFLLLIPYLQSNPSPPRGKKNIRKHQVQKQDQSKIRKKSVALKAWRDCWKEEENQEQDVLLQIHCKGSSLGDKGDTTPHPFWNMKGKPEQFTASHQLSYLSVLWEHMEQKCSQLFWGLPSLLSESLVAVAWVSKRCSSTRPKTVPFKEACTCFPDQHEVEEPPMLSQAQALPQDVAQPQFRIQNLPSVANIQTQTQIPCSFPNQPPASPSQKAQSFVPTENQHLEFPLQNRLKWRKALTSKLQKSRDAISQPTLNLPQGIQASQTPESVFILPEDSKNSELQEHREQHGQGRVVKDEKKQDHPFRFQASQELMPPQGKFPWKSQYQAKDNPGPTQPSALICESNKVVQKVGPTCSGRPSKKGLVVFKLSDPSKGLEQDLRRDPGGLAWSSGSTSEKGLEDGKGDSGSDLTRLRKCHSGSFSSKAPDKKHREKLKIHLDRKLEQIHMGLIPVCVRRSWLAAPQAFPKSNTHTEPTKPASWKGRPARVNTSQVLSFLDPKTRLMLESDVIRSRLRHRWGPHLQALEPVNPNRDEAPAPPFLQPVFLSSASSDSGANSLAKVAKFLEELPRKCPGEKVTTKVPLETLQSPLPATSPAELQRAQRGTPAGGTLGSIEACPSAQGGSPPAQPHTFSLLGRIQQSRTVLGTGSGDLKPSPSPEMARHEPQEECSGVASGDNFCSVTMLQIKVGPQSSMAKETREMVKAEESHPAWEVTVDTGMKENSPVINISLSSSGSPGSRKSPSPYITPTLQDPAGVLGLKAQAMTEVDPKLDVKSEKQPQDLASSILPDCHTAMLPTSANQPTQAFLPSSESMTGSDMAASEGLCHQSMGVGHRQGQQEPRLTDVKVPGRNPCTFGAADGRGVPGRPREEEQEERPAKVMPSQDWGLSPPAHLGEKDTVETKSCPYMPEKRQASAERHIKKRTRHFLQYLNPNPKEKRPEDAPQRVKAPAATARSQGTVTGRPGMDSGAAEAHTLVTVVGKILVDKLGLWHASGPSESHWHKEKPQALLGRYSYHYRDPRDPEQGRMMAGMGCAHHASPKGHSHPIRWTRDRDGNQVFLPKRPVSPASPCQHKTCGAGASGHLHYYPAHCLQKGVLFG